MATMQLFDDGLRAIVTVRPADVSELSAVHQLIQTSLLEDWSDITMETIEIYHKLDPTGFKVAFITETSVMKLVGVFVACNINDDYGFGDLFVVSPDYRGRGIGSLLLREARRHFADRNWGVDAELGSVKLFSKLGCKCSGKIQNYCGIPVVPKRDALQRTPECRASVKKKHRFDKENVEEAKNLIPVMRQISLNVTTDGFYKNKELTTNGKRSKSLADISDLLNTDIPSSCKRKMSLRTKETNKATTSQRNCSNRSYTILSGKDVDFNDIFDYDTRIHCTPRSHHLKLWFNYPGSHTRVCVDTNKRIVGYACARPIGNREYEISPLFANSTTIAQLLICDIVKRYSGFKMNVQVPMRNRKAVQLMKSLGLKRDDAPYTRMYSKVALDVPFERVFAMYKLGFA